MPQGKNSARSQLGRRRKSVAGQAVDLPLLELDRAEAVVEADRPRVPVENGPLEPAAAALDGEASKLDHERLAVPLAAGVGADEQVFEVEPRLAGKGRVVVEEEGEAGDDA